jgi:hypothetical protein
MDKAQADAQEQNDLMKSLLMPMEEELNFYRQRNQVQSAAVPSPVRVSNEGL